MVQGADGRYYLYYCLNFQPQLRVAVCDTPAGEYKYLGKINSPDDLKSIPDDELGKLCSEIRNCLITTVSENGGHLASNLGVVELA